MSRLPNYLKTFFDGGSRTVLLVEMHRGLMSFSARTRLLARPPAPRSPSIYTGVHAAMRRDRSNVIVTEFKVRQRGVSRFSIRARNSLLQKDDRKPALSAAPCVV